MSKTENTKTQLMNRAHMKVAQIYAELSYCNKKKVGCVIVKNDTPIAIGFNGTPKGEINVCECDKGHTLPNVIHAEDNALRKLMRSNESSVDAIVYITYAPCERCAEKLVDAQVSKVYYSKPGEKIGGIAYLKKHSIPIEQLT